VIALKRVQIGAVAEIPVKSGFAYLQATHKVPKWGYLVSVFPGIYKTRPNIQLLTRVASQFRTFFPLQIAVNQGICSLIGRFDLSDENKEFPLFRAPGFIDKERRVHNWWLWDGKRSWQIEKLTEEQKKLPIKGVVNDTALISRIESRWRPEKDRRWKID
jgi:hypothetical protein